MSAAALGQLLPYRPPRAREETTAWLGMVIFLGSWAMLFAALFFSYAYIRARNGAAWPPEGVPRMPILWPGLNTLVIGGSSALIQLGLVMARRAKPALIRPLWLGGIALGVLFMALQTYLWLSLHAKGLTLL